jgi:hypothetical protein
VSDTDAAERSFTAAGEAWLVRPAGLGTAGSGRSCGAVIAAVHFFRAGEPERPLREALLPVGQLSGLYEEELLELWSRAKEIVLPEGRGS